jgi:hypothetical protein
MYFVVLIVIVNCYLSQSTIYHLFQNKNKIMLRPNVQYVKFVVVHICKTCEFYCCPLQSFVFHHKVDIEVLKILNFKILEIPKMVIVVLG